MGETHEEHIRRLHAETVRLEAESKTYVRVIDTLREEHQRLWGENRHLRAVLAEILALFMRAGPGSMWEIRCFVDEKKMREWREGLK